MGVSLQSITALRGAALGLAGVGIWEKATSLGKELKRGWFVGSVGAVSRGWGMLPLVLCCSARDKTAGLAQGGRAREKKAFWQSTLFSSRLGMWFSRGCLLELVTWIQQVVRQRWSTGSSGDVGGGRKTISAGVPWQL